MNQHPPAVTWPAYLDGALEPLQQEEIERHLADCPACRADLEAQRALRGRLGNLAPDSSAYLSSAATERAWGAVHPRLQTRPRALLLPLRRLAFGLGTTALLAFFVLSLWALFVQQAGPSRTGEQPPVGAPLPSPTLASTGAFTLTVSQNVAYEPDYEGARGDLVPVLFTIELYNNGPGVAAQVRVTATLPALLIYLARSAGGDAAYDAGTHTVTWAGSLAPHATHTISFACGVPQSVGGPGTTATNHVVIDDGVHALFTDTLTVNFTPWPTVVPTPGPIPTRTSWITPTPSTLLVTPTSWMGTFTPSSSLATPTPWLTPTPGAAPTATVTPRVTPGPTLPATPTPWFPPTSSVQPTPTATPPVPPPPTLPATPTLWFTPTTGPPPTATATPGGPPSPTPTPWLTLTAGGPLTATPPPPPPQITSTPARTPTPGGTPRPTPTPRPT